MNKCEICDKQIITNEFSDHLKKEHNISISKYIEFNDLTCKKCLIEYKTKYTLKSHKCKPKIISKSLTKKYTCKKCGKNDFENQDYADICTCDEDIAIDIMNLCKIKMKEKVKLLSIGELNKLKNELEYLGDEKREKRIILDTEIYLCNKVINKT